MDKASPPVSPASPSAEGPAPEPALALRRIRRASIAALVFGILTLVVFTTAIVLDGTRRMGSFNDPVLILDGVLYMGLALGIYRRSRFAAVFLSVYFFVEKSFIVAADPPALIMAAPFFYFFARGIQGTFAYQRWKRRNGQACGSTKRAWVCVAVSPVLLVAVALTMLGILMEVGAIPGTVAVPGEELAGKDLKTLYSMGVSHPGEKILYFYSGGIFSVEEDGNFFTGERVVSYAMEDGEFVFYSASFEEIAGMEVEYSENFMDDTVIWIETFDGRSFFLIVSNEERGDEKFYSMLHELWVEKTKDIRNEDEEQEGIDPSISAVVG